VLSVDISPDMGSQSSERRSAWALLLVRHFSYCWHHLLLPLLVRHIFYFWQCIIGCCHCWCSIDCRCFCKWRLVATPAAWFAVHSFCSCSIGPGMLLVQFVCRCFCGCSIVCCWCSIVWCSSIDGEAAGAVLFAAASAGAALFAAGALGVFRLCLRVTAVVGAVSCWECCCGALAVYRLYLRVQLRFLGRRLLM
jgi:hypothetical protein